MGGLNPGYDIDALLSRRLDKSDYYFTNTDVYKHFNISDRVLCFYNGINWNIIKLQDMLGHSVLHYDYWLEKDKKMYTNTLIVCPLTMRSMIYKGKVLITDVINDRLYLFNADTNDYFFMDLPYTGDTDSAGKEKVIKSHVKRFEVKVHTLRDAYVSITDPKYIIVNITKTTIVPEIYYDNNLTYDGKPIHTSYHPKTIVYIIQYWSFKLKKYIYNVVVGKNINKKYITGYNHKKSGFDEFLKSYRDKALKNKAYIYPIFWYMVDKLYDDVNFIIVE